MGKLSDLKYAQELHSRSLRQRDRDHTRLQQVHQALESLQASIPSYSQEKKNAQKEVRFIVMCPVLCPASNDIVVTDWISAAKMQFISAEEESIKQEELVVGIRGEVDFMMRSLRKSELLGDNILKQVRQCNQRVWSILPTFSPMLQLIGNHSLFHYPFLKIRPTKNRSARKEFCDMTCRWRCWKKNW